MADTKKNLPTEFPITEYKCGLKAGDRVELVRDLIIRDDYGFPTGKAFLKGEIWTVHPGAKDDPVVVWFRRTDNNLHTWDDNESLYKTFRKIETS